MDEEVEQMQIRLESPEQALGFRVGTDRCLAGWEQVMSYLAHLSQSQRMNWEQIGLTTEGRDLYLATISSPANLGRLEELRGIQKRLADPRGLDDEERARLLEGARCVMLLTSSIHATEVGSTQMIMELVHQLVTDDSLAGLLEEVILLVVPCLNPDGLDMVVDWYRETLDTPHEGTAPPRLYHKYTGHDNNRDWFMLTQAENRAVVERVHNRWHPHIVFDQHQMGPDGPRYVLPPYIDPVDPHVDPVLTAAAGSLGAHMAHELIAGGLPGVAINVIYDCYSPSRAYQHYHGGVRILSEAASCRLATPVDVPAAGLTARRGFDPGVRTWNNPLPWTGGRWTLRDIVDYQKAAALACLRHAASNRRLWAEGFLAATDRAVSSSGGQAGYLIPVPGTGATAPEELAEVLARGLVEVFRLTGPVTVAGREYGAGSLWIPLDQPFSAFARTLLATGSYPDLRQYPGGPPRVPYDITGHNLSLLMGVEVAEVTGDEDGAGARAWSMEGPVDAGVLGAVSPPPGDRARAWILPGRRQRSFALASAALAAGQEVYRLEGRERDDAGVRGDFLIVGALPGDVPPGLEVTAAGDEPAGGWRQIRLPHVALYRSHVPCADEGWTRFVLERYGFPCLSVTDADIRRGLPANVDILIFPDQKPDLIRDGLKPGTHPAQFTGGLGPGGARAVEEFVSRGGSVLALGQACSYVAGEMGLPVRDAALGLDPGQFYAPGTLVHVVIDVHHPAGLGMDRRAVGIITGGPVLETAAGRAIATFPWQDVAADGFLQGENRLHGRPAVWEIEVGDGLCVLSSLRLQFRAQARGTYPLLFNILHHAASRRERG